MTYLPRLGMPALAMAISAFAVPALASLETTSSYPSSTQEQVAINEYTGAISCTPGDVHYSPSFIRALDGTIIGVGYIEVVDSEAAGC